MELITGQFLKQMRLYSGLRTMKIAQAMDKLEYTILKHEKTLNVTFNQIYKRAFICSDFEVLAICDKLIAFNGDNNISGSFLAKIRGGKESNKQPLPPSHVAMRERSKEATINRIKDWAEIYEDKNILSIVAEFEELQISRNEDYAINLNFGE